MTTKNAIEILQKCLEKNPALKEAYLREKQNNHIAYKIREYRKAMNFTQKKLAQLIGTKQSVISRIENAEYTGHSLPLLKKIAEVLSIRIEDLLWEKNGPPQVLSLHTPHIMKKAASFQNWHSNQIITKRSYAG